MIGRGLLPRQVILSHGLRKVIDVSVEKAPVAAKIRRRSVRRPAVARPRAALDPQKGESCELEAHSNEELSACKPR